MRIIKERSAYAQISELRTKMDVILGQLRDSPVTLEKRNRPIAILEDPKRFEAMQTALESASDILLAFEARKRELSSKAKDYASLEDVLRRFL
ncbi:MAG: hypothetical protein HY078_00905 [Elusimicrobia bacterium]|nr:hypothetical protein [Elusimicrobiota bacterium]